MLIFEFLAKVQSLPVEWDKTEPMNSIRSKLHCLCPLAEVMRQHKSVSASLAALMSPAYMAWELGIRPEDDHRVEFGVGDASYSGVSFGWRIANAADNAPGRAFPFIRETLMNACGLGEGPNGNGIE